MSEPVTAVTTSDGFSHNPLMYAHTHTRACMWRGLGLSRHLPSLPSLPPPDRDLECRKRPSPTPTHPINHHRARVIAQIRAASGFLGVCRSSHTPKHQTALSGLLRRF